MAQTPTLTDSWIYERCRAAGYAQVPYFSLQAGFYSEPVAVEITNFNAGDTIQYALDGSWVTDTSQIYTGLFRWILLPQ
ncbi:MAG: chitobiase/beta-hexosaminidase C-terminal domain-containing protein [Bacteroidales bacterium]